MTADPNLMNKLVAEEHSRVKQLVAKFMEMMKLARVSDRLIVCDVAAVFTSFCFDFSLNRM